MDIQNDMPGETTEELLSAAAEAGFLLSRRQIAEWHRRGYLPSPQRVGLGRRHGSVSVYPAGTKEQLLLLCHYKERAPHDMDQVVWALWWDGHANAMEPVRLRLQQVADDWTRGIEDLRAHFWDTGELEEGEKPLLSDEILDHLDKVVTKRLSRKTLAQARKRLGKDRFDTFARILLEIAIGEFEGFADNQDANEQSRTEGQLVEIGLGLQRARTDRILGIEPWLKGGIEEVLVSLSHNLREMPPSHDVETRTNDDLLRARDEMRLFLQLISGFSHLAEYYLGKYAFGFSAMARAIQEARADDQAIMLLFWFAMRSWGLGEGMDVLVGVARQWEHMWDQALNVFQLLATEVPETAEMLAPKHVGAALKSQASWDTLLSQIREFYEHHSDQLLAFFAQHTELRWPVEEQLAAVEDEHPESEDPGKMNPDPS